MKTSLFDRLKPEYKNRNWTYDSLKSKLQNYQFYGQLTLNDIWMMEYEFLTSLNENYKIFNLFQDEKA